MKNREHHDFSVRIEIIDRKRKPPDKRPAQSAIIDLVALGACGDSLKRCPDFRCQLSSKLSFLSFIPDCGVRGIQSGFYPDPQVHF